MEVAQHLDRPQISRGIQPARRGGSFTDYAEVDRAALHREVDEFDLDAAIKFLALEAKMGTARPTQNTQSEERFFQKLISFTGLSKK